MEVRFWGVRGSVPVSGPQYAATGGNTSCVELTHEGERLILDGGTGLRALGDAMGGAPIEATLLFSHVHWDHIQGVPFFGPAYDPRSRITFAGAGHRDGSIRDALADQMRPPTFPVTLDMLGARIDYRSVMPGAPSEFGPFRVIPVDLNHPDGVLAYRVEAGGASVVYATDTEHGAALDPRLLKLAEGADLLIHDAQYTDAEYAGASGPPRRGWGHSTWRQAVACARDAAARNLALFHHDPRRDDGPLAGIEAAARSLHAGCFAAREGLRVTL